MRELWAPNIVGPLGNGTVQYKNLPKFWFLNEPASCGTGPISSMYSITVDIYPVCFTLCFPYVLLSMYVFRHVSLLCFLCTEWNFLIIYELFPIISMLTIHSKFPIPSTAYLLLGDGKVAINGSTCTLYLSDW